MFTRTGFVICVFLLHLGVAQVYECQGGGKERKVEQGVRKDCVNNVCAVAQSCPNRDCSVWHSIGDLWEEEGVVFDGASHKAKRKCTCESHSNGARLMCEEYGCFKAINHRKHYFAPGSDNGLCKCNIDTSQTLRSYTLVCGDVPTGPDAPCFVQEEHSVLAIGSTRDVGEYRCTCNKKAAHSQLDCVHTDHQG